MTGANGQIVESKRAITQENPEKYVTQDGKSVRCIQGFEFKASSNQELMLKDLQRYYQLQPGTYAVTLAIELDVYRDSIAEEDPEILELRRDMARLQNDPNLQTAAKQDAVNYYQEQIKFIQERSKDEQKTLLACQIASWKSTACIERDYANNNVSSRISIYRRVNDEKYKTFPFVWHQFGNGIAKSL